MNESRHRSRRRQPIARKMKRWTGPLVCLLAIWPGAPSVSAEVSPGREPAELGGLEFEDLMRIKVTSVSKREELLSTAPAAVHVLSGESIRRSGATSLPEALRYVPGVNVARLDAHTWAVSSRGFNEAFANKLLVMIDGRSIYTPLFSGVSWDQQDVMFEDLDRIEVVRGPGATLWGANAVNGVVNIITKHAKDTQGLLISGGGGTEERGFGAVRYGGKINDQMFYRVYGKYFDRDDSVLSGGQRARDDGSAGQGGFRMDWDVSETRQWTFQGDLYAGRYGQAFIEAVPVPPTFTRTFQDHVDVAGANLLSRWSQTFSERSDLALQVYYDGTHRDVSLVSDERHTFDIDGQHHFALGERQNVIWGLGYRVSSDRLGESRTIQFDPDGRTTQLFSSFLQDEVAIVPERLSATLGTKLEHNDYTGLELQPSARLSWKVTERQTLWAAVSRAVRTPSQAENDIRIIQQEFLIPNPFVPTNFFRGFVSVKGNRAFESEKLVAYEVGYRAMPHERLAIDLAAFYNVYDDLRTIEPLPPGIPPPLEIPFTGANLMLGETYGGEVAAHWKTTEWWRLSAFYSYLDVQLHLRSKSRDIISETATEGSSPQHQLAFRSSMDLPGAIEFDVGLRYVDGLPAQNVPSYLALDVRLGWRPCKDVELAIVGQHLLDDQHPEFTSALNGTRPTEVEHGVYAKLTWRY
jgi:iron complex outermembrane recepter protein